MTDNIGALFDLDGVLLDSESVYSQFWNAVDERFPTHVTGFADVIKGSNLHDILHTYFATDAMRKAVVELLQDLQEDMEYRFFDGALDFVRQLNARDIPTCVVTSSDRQKMASLHRQHPDFAAHFGGIVTGDMVSRAKPDPECFLKGAALIGRDIGDCIVFEDSLKGLAAGRAAGATVVALATTLKPEQLRGHADLIIDSLADRDIASIIAAARG